VTQVLVTLHKPESAGNVPVPGHIRATPTRRRTVGDTIVLPIPFTASLTAGVVTVELAANGADWCWRIEEMTSAMAIMATRYVAVPESGSTLGYEDLVDVDPDTLDPAVEPQAAWDLALENTDAVVASLDARLDVFEAEHPIAGSRVIVLDETDPVPEGTPAFTLIARAVSVPPAPTLAVVESTKTTVRGTTGVNIALDIPAGTVTGDLLVAVVTNSTTGGTISTPAGWEILQHLSTFADYRATYVFGYRVTGAAPGNPTFVASGSGRFVGSMFRVVGASLTTPVAVNGTNGSRTTNTMNVPALLATAGALVLSVTNEQATSPNQPIPAVLPAGFTKMLELGSGDDTGVTRTVLVIGWQLATADIPAHAVVAASSIAAGASQIVAIKALP
jgi:hypothetical protein